MQKTPIEWCDYTTNPFTGCSRKCAYCYGLRSAPWRGRTGADKAYEPTVHRERWGLPGKVREPSIVFVCSVSDIMDPAFDDQTIRELLQAFARFDWHTMVYLTKNPSRLPYFNPWPRNSWVGASATDQPMAEFASDCLGHVDAPVRLISFEPILAPIALEEPPPIDWMILGGETRNGHPTGRTKKDWAWNLAIQGGAWGVPVFVKDNIPSITPRPRLMPGGIERAA